MIAEAMFPGATARPWANLVGVTLNALPEESVGGLYWSALVAVFEHGAHASTDAALTAQAVNEYDALLEVAAAAVLRHTDSNDQGFYDRLDHALKAFEALIKQRRQ